MYYIYQIENIKNHKKYIGLTNNVERRKNRHFSDLKGDRHDNHFLQYEYNKYGKDNFVFSILFEGDVSSQTISDLEKYYIKKVDSFHNGYNQNEGGNFGPANGGTKFTKEDIFNILSTCDFQKRCYPFLANFYDVTATTIYRIYHGQNFCLYFEEYHNLSNEDKRKIYDEFDLKYNVAENITKRQGLKTLRHFTKEEIFFILACDEFKIMPRSHLAKKMNCADSTIAPIQKHLFYKDYCMEYNNLTTEEKQKYCDLIR